MLTAIKRLRWAEFLSYIAYSLPGIGIKQESAYCYATELYTICEANDHSCYVLFIGDCMNSAYEGSLRKCKEYARKQERSTA